jgi:hypothetical protein
MGQVEGEEKKKSKTGGWLQGWRPEMKKREGAGGCCLGCRRGKKCSALRVFLVAFFNCKIPPL